jgi:hypothetical protein
MNVVSRREPLGIAGLTCCPPIHQGRCQREHAVETRLFARALWPAQPVLRRAVAASTR